MTTKLKLRAVHPVAALFPMMDEESLRELASSIGASGLLQPIVLDKDGAVLDGRNRLAACEIAGVEPAFDTYEGDDPDGYALAVNIDRREMSKGQKAMVAASAVLLSNNQTSVAKTLGISQPFISMAKVVQESTPDVVPAVIAGTLALKDAYDNARSEAKREKARIERMSALPTDLRVMVEQDVLTVDDAEERQRYSAALAVLDADLRLRVESDADGMDLDEAELVMADRAARLNVWAEKVTIAAETFARMGGHPIPDALAARLDEDTLAIVKQIVTTLPTRGDSK